MMLRSNHRDTGRDMEDSRNTPDEPDEADKKGRPGRRHPLEGLLTNANEDDDWGIPSLSFPTVKPRPVPAPDTDENAKTTVIQPIDMPLSLEEVADAPTPADEADLVDVDVDDKDKDNTTVAPTVVAPPVTGTAELASLAGGGQTAPVPAAPVPPAAVPPTSPRTNAGDGRDDDHGHGTTNGRPRGHRPWFVAVVAVIVVAVAATGLFLYRHQRQSSLDAALAGCGTSASNVSTAVKALDKALDKAKTAQDTAADQVADATTLSDLETVVGEAKSSYDAQACDASLGAAKLAAAEAANAKTTDAINDEITKLNKAVEAVDASHKEKAKELATQAVQTLTPLVAEARTLYEGSAGAVADDATRQTLQQDIDKANTLLDEDAPDPDDLNDAVTALQNDMAAVNESINAANAYRYQQAQRDAQQNQNAQQNTTQGTTGQQNQNGATDQSQQQGTTQQGQNGNGTVTQNGATGQSQQQGATTQQGQNGATASGSNGATAQNQNGANH